MGNPTRVICNFYDKPGHHQDGYIKRGPPSWPDWYTQKVEQFNTTHGLQSKKSSKDIATPPPPKPCFEPNLQAIQTTVDQVTSKLEQQLNDNTEDEALMHHAITVCHVQSEDNSQVIIEDQFDVQSESGSAYALGSDTTSELAYNDLELYNQPVNW